MIAVIALGILLLVVSYFTGVVFLWQLGIILIVIGVVLAVAGLLGRPLGPRSHYY